MSSSKETGAAPLLPTEQYCHPEPHPPSRVVELACEGSHPGSRTLPPRVSRPTAAEDVVHQGSEVRKVAEPLVGVGTVPAPRSTRTPVGPRTDLRLHAHPQAWSRPTILLTLCTLCVSAVHSDGPAIHRITRDGKQKEDLAWAPDGRSFTCSYYHQTGRIGVAVGDAESGKLQVLSKDPVERSPSWSPDGKRIVFIHVTHSGTDGELDIHEMNADGAERKHLVQMGGKSFENFPSYSPDGSKLLFTTTRDKTQEIYVCDADGKNLKRLTSDPSLKQYPRWSPDGKQIAFNSNQDGNFEIYVMNADGSGMRRVTNHPTTDVCPAWAPDGKRLAFVSLRDTNPEIYVVNLDGTGLRNVSSHEGYDYFPAWKPDGRTLTWVSDRESPYDVYATQP